MMPECYDGKSPWPQFLAHFETVAELNMWTGRSKALYLASSLRGEACNVLKFLSPEVKRDYGALVATLSKRFGSGHSAGLFRVQLRTKHRKDRETIPQLAESIREMASQAYPTADQRLFDSLCCDHFIEALHDDDLKLRLYHLDYKRFDDLVAYATKDEAITKARRIRQHKKYVNDIHAEFKQPTVAENDDEGDGQPCFAIQSGKNSQQNDTESKDVKITLQRLMKMMQEYIDSIATCYYCQEVGHKRPRCPLLHGKDGSPAATTQNKSN